MIHLLIVLALSAPAAGELSLHPQPALAAASGLPADLPLHWELDGTWQFDPVGKRVQGSYVLHSGTLQWELHSTDAGLTLGPGGGHWFTLGGGHPALSEHELDLAFLDLRLGPDLAQAMGRPRLAGQWLGSATLSGAYDGVPHAKGLGGRCPTGPNFDPANFNPRWPGQDGAQVDLAMSALPAVDVTDAAGDLIAVTPSVEFTVVGDADIPWFAMFASPGNDPYCVDRDGDEGCDPYGVDQQGLLVWSLYRLSADGVLQPLAESGVKHAFASSNTGCSCAYGRVAFSGCSDLYHASTNADPTFLGPRSDIDPAGARWLSPNAFDGDGDGHCDGAGPFSWGEWPCRVPDHPDYRLQVDTAELADTAARYFMEAYYLVRDDVNPRNSLAWIEVAPRMVDGLWQFELIGSMQLGSVLEHAFSQSQAAGSAGDAATVAYTVTRLGPQRWRYAYGLHNHNRSDPLRELRSEGAGTTGVEAGYFHDADGDPSTDWMPAMIGETLVWQAPGGAGGLGWGRTASLGFEAATPPRAGMLSVRGASSSVEVAALVPNGDAITLIGFEAY